MKLRLLAATTLAFGFAAMPALADSAIVDGLGGPLTLSSKEIPGVFGQGSPVFSNAVMDAIHTDVQADGITTDGLVTFMLLETDHGLSFVTLVDDNLQTATGKTRTGLAMSSTAPDSSARFINDSDEDIQLFFDPPNNTKTAAGEFTWNANRRGDGFAWAGLLNGDFLTYAFDRDGTTFPTHPGLDENNTFQFISWDGSSWNIVATRSFSVNDQFAFSLTVIPLPAPLMLGLAGLGLAGLARRRMMNKA